VWAVLDLLITHDTNGIPFTQLDRQHSPAPDTKTTLT
jgi:hypothetical protein